MDRNDFETLLADTPEDWDLRAIFADWLEEQGDDKEAAAQRWQVENGKILSYYGFRQNNSGGVWHGPRYIAVRAGSHEAANRIVADYDDSPVYFDGVSLGWWPAWRRVLGPGVGGADHCPHPDAVIIDTGEY